MKDALKEDFSVNLILDATKPLDQETFSNQLDELNSKGVTIVNAEELL